MKSIDVFPWNENFNTGISKIDEQHQKLVQLLNILASHLAFQSDIPGDICAVTLSKFTGEKGADISSQNIYLGDSQTRHLKISDDEYQKKFIGANF